MPTSGQKLPALVSKVRSFLNENVEDFWQDGDIQQWIQQGKNLVCKHGNFPFMEHSEVINFNQGATTVPKPAGLKKVIRMKLNGTTIDPIAFRNWPDEPTSGYTEYGDNFLIPAQAAAGSIEVFCYRIVPDIDDNISYFDPNYEDIIIDYAARRGRIKEIVLAPDQVDALEKFIKEQLDLFKINSAQAQPPGMMGSLRGI